MERLGWSLGLVVTFALGAMASGLLRGIPAKAPEVQHLQAVVERQELQISTLRARLLARESAPQRGVMGYAAPVQRDQARDVSLPAASVEPDGASNQGGSRRAGGPPREDLGSPGRAGRAPAATPATVEAALDRFYRFLDDVSGPGGASRWSRTRDAAADLRGMGDPGIEALMRVLANGTSADERRAAAQLLGELQAARALPLLQTVLEQDNDVLLRRAAASALRRLETPDTIPMLQALLSNPGEDRFVRMSAAFGLARLGQAEGVAGLTMIFAETNGDGRGRDVAFRSLISLNDERALPFMRQLVTSGAEPGYRLQAIRFLAAQGDRQALPALEQIMQTSTEQPSIRDAATQAHATIAGR